MKKLFFYIIYLLSPILVLAQDIPDRPNPPRLVNDYTGILSAEEIAHLEQKLVLFNDSTSTQITVVIVTDLNGYDKAEFADRLGEKWKVGQKGFDNGVVILIKPVGGEGQREAFIAVGYGLGGVIPDAIAKRIVENEMIPYFKNDQYYQGIEQATNVLMALAKKEFSAADYKKKTDTKPIMYLIPILATLLVFVLMQVGRYRSTRSSMGKNLPWLAAFMLMASNNSRGSSGAWGSFSSGSGSFGGSSFGGFGGGSFGGGGAGGSW